MTRPWHLALFAGIIMAVNAPCQGDAQRARVTIQITDSLGDPVPPGDLVVRHASGPPVYAGRATDGTELQLDYGQYTFVFKTKFFQETRREVTIQQSDVLVMLPVQWENDVLDQPTNVPVSVSLRLTPAESCIPGGSMAVKLFGVFSNSIYERRIMAGGYSLFDGVSVGTYVILVLDGRTVRATKTIVTKGPLTTDQVSIAPCRQ